MPAAPPIAADTAGPPAPDPGKPTAVVVLGSEGANAADVLAPYEVLAGTGAFNVYTVAARPEPVRLTGGLDLVPDLTFEQLTDRLPGAPDVIVVPQLPGTGGLSTTPVVEWLRQQRAEGDPLLMSMCTGADVLASAGLLDGRPATSHWLGLIGLRRDHPAVRWQDGVRFVDDGDVITTAGVLSGVDGALRVIERVFGPAAAGRAARAVSWPGYSPGEAAPIPRSRPAPADVVGLLSAGYRWDRPSTGVLITEGVGEIERASAFRPYTELSYLARPVAVTVDGQPIRSRHGLTFAPRAELGAAAPELDRLVVAGADAARRAAADRLPLPERLTPVHLHDRPGFAFDGALRDIARTYDVTTARWVAKTLQYPTTDPELSGPAWPWALTLKVIPPVAVSAPGRSNLRSASRAWSASISTNAPMSAAPARGTLTKNTASQPRERVSTPPSKTPDHETGRAATAPDAEGAVAVTSFGERHVDQREGAGEDQGATEALNRTGSQLNLRSGREPPGCDATAYSARPVTSIRRRPSRSAARPPNSRNPLDATA